jgi:predicted AAA+ superfamily ATPase
MKEQTNHANWPIFERTVTEDLKQGIMNSAFVYIRGHRRVGKAFLTRTILENQHKKFLLFCLNVTHDTFDNALSRETKRILDKTLDDYTHA